MAGNKFNRYLWLINILRTEGPVPFKVISEKWRFSVYNDSPGKPLPLKTFHNHCEIIAELFGVEVDCEKGGKYGYFLSEPASSEKWKMDVLDNLLLLSMMQEEYGLRDKVINLDTYEHEDLLPVLHCIHERRLITIFTRAIPGEVISQIGRGPQMRKSEAFKNCKHISVKQFLPLGMAQVDFTWFVFGVFPRNEKDKNIYVYTLNTQPIGGIKPSSEVWGKEMPEFSVKDFLDKFPFIKKNQNDHSEYLAHRLHILNIRNSQLVSVFENKRNLEEAKNVTF